MAEQATPNKKDFFFCLFILAAIYSCGTLLYYSQTFLLFRFYDSDIVKEMLSGWNYLAQAAGMILFAVLFRFCGGISGKKKFQVLVSLTLPPVMTLSVFTQSGSVLIIMTVLLNLAIGMLTAFAFSLIAAFIKVRRCTLCFASAYSIGGILTYLICQLNEEILVSYFVITLSCVFVGIICALVLSYKDVDAALSPVSDPNAPNSLRKSDISCLYLVIALMGVIFTLGANDPILVESGNRLDLIFTRFFYAGGLILAAIIFDRNHIIGSICALASILYPMMLIILYKEMPVHYIPIALIDTFSGFYSVFRAGIFISLASRKGRLYLAPFGLCVSRIVEGIMAVSLACFKLDRLTCFIMAGVLFVPLIILFCYLLTKFTRNSDSEVSDAADPSSMGSSSAICDTADLSSDSSRLAASYTAVSSSVGSDLLIPNAARLSFADIYHLTRREDEISEYLADHKTNGEIADLLYVSESTVRFHVSNILKKTGMKNRNEVGRRYHELKEPRL